MHISYWLVFLCSINFVYSNCYVVVFIVVSNKLYVSDKTMIWKNCNPLVKIMVIMSLIRVSIRNIFNRYKMLRAFLHGQGDACIGTCSRIVPTPVEKLFYFLKKW